MFDGVVETGMGLVDASGKEMRWGGPVLLTVDLR